MSLYTYELSIPMNLVNLNLTGDNHMSIGVDCIIIGHVIMWIHYQSCVMVVIILKCHFMIAFLSLGRSLSRCYALFIVVVVVFVACPFVLLRDPCLQFQGDGI